MADERTDPGIEVAVAVVAQVQFGIVILALQAQRLGDLVHRDLCDPAQVIVRRRPDDLAVGSGQFPGQAVGIVVIVIDLAVAVNSGQRLEGVRIVDVLAGRLIFEALGEQGIAGPGEKRPFPVDGLAAASAKGIVGHGDVGGIGRAGAFETVPDIPGKTGQAIAFPTLNQIAGGIIGIQGSVVSGAAQAQAGIGQMLEQIAGRIVRQVMEPLLGVQGPRTLLLFLYARPRYR